MPYLFTEMLIVISLLSENRIFSNQLTIYICINCFRIGQLCMSFD